CEFSMRRVAKRPIVVDESEWKDKVRYWIKKEMRTGNTYGWEREILLDLDDVPVAPHFEPYVRTWFAGTAPVLPLTEPRPPRRGMSTTVVRILIAAAIEEDRSGHNSQASQVLVDRASAVCEEFLYEQTPPFDVCELNYVLSNDDDEQMVALDASMRLEDRIRRNSPLHPLRLMLTWLQSVNWDYEALVEMLFDDDSGRTGGFPLAERFYEWARVRRAALRAVARTWRYRIWETGTWQNMAVPCDDDEEDEEEMVVNTSFVEVEDDSPFEFDIFMANPGVEPEQPMDVEDEEEPEDEELTSSFMINITQMAGNLECQKQFLLPPDEERRRLILPSRKEEWTEADVWPKLIAMTRRLARKMEATSRNPLSTMRREAKELAENMRLFLQAELLYND
ncbi:hypothetical protein PRIPAC_79724, partial [Pristionchus pacificus]